MLPYGPSRIFGLISTLKKERLEKMTSGKTPNLIQNEISVSAKDGENLSKSKSKFYECFLPIRVIIPTNHSILGWANAWPYAECFNELIRLILTTG